MSKPKTFADLVENDYNGEPLHYDARKREALVEDTLRAWCRNDAGARVLIEGVGIRDAVVRYVEEWDAAHEDEYGTADDDDRVVVP